MTLPYTGSCPSGPCFEIIATGSGDTAIAGTANSGSSAWGVSGTSTSGYGFYGFSTSGYGIYARSNGAYNKPGVFGYSGGSGGTGVWGECDSGTGAVGVEGYSSTGKAGYFYGGPTGVYAYGTTRAGDFIGNVNVAGTLSATSKNFLIDHPFEPESKYLVHASIESSEMLNLYTGNAVLDEHGEATIEVPPWFEALNTDFRYQLTAIGASGPSLFVAEEIAVGHFRIAGGAPGMKVSWLVSGVRQDRWALQHPLQVEQEKPLQELGTYLFPELYGQPKERGVDWANSPEERGRQEEQNPGSRQ